MRDEWLGVYVRQEGAVEGRPMFKKPHQEQFIFFTTDGCWAAGADTSKPFGMWEVTSAATARRHHGAVNGVRRQRVGGAAVRQYMCWRMAAAGRGVVWRVNYVLPQFIRSCIVQHRPIR